MKRTLLLSVLFVLTVSIFNSCSKFEDGPKMSLKSKKARLANAWAFDKITDLTTGDEMTPEEFFGMTDDSTGMSYTIEMNFVFEKDGTFNAEYSVMGFTFTSPGTWEFVGDTGLEITIDMSEMGGETQTMEMEIKRLASNELWLVYEEDGEQYEFYMIPAE